MSTLKHRETGSVSDDHRTSAALYKKMINDKNDNTIKYLPIDKENSARSMRPLSLKWTRSRVGNVPA